MRTEVTALADRIRHTGLDLNDPGGVENVARSLSGVTVELGSPDRSVWLSMTAAGTIRDLRIASEAMSQTDESALAATITKVIQRGEETVFGALDAIRAER